VREMGLEPACSKFGTSQIADKRDDYTVFRKIVQAEYLPKKQKIKYKWVIKWVTNSGVSQPLPPLKFPPYRAGS
ncbi:hypothetical protein LJB68_14085, partial [bacterium 210820-DFI.6.52]|nr:hypothetical protein [bacterium 210820-DFI.6.52]